MMALDCLERACNLDPAYCFENVVVVACAAVEVLMMVFVFAAGNSCVAAVEDIVVVVDWKLLDCYCNLK